MADTRDATTGRHMLYAELVLLLLPCPMFGQFAVLWPCPPPPPPGAVVAGVDGVVELDCAYAYPAPPIPSAPMTRPAAASRPALSLIEDLLIESCRDPTSLSHPMRLVGWEFAGNFVK